MRPIYDDALEALRGSRAGDRIEVFVRYGEQLAWPDPLPISRYGFSWDSSRQVQRFACSVTDETGELAPWLLEDPLGVGGARLDVRYYVGGTDQPVLMGIYRVASNAPDERWFTYIIDNKGEIHRDSPIPNGKKLEYVSGGSNIEVTAYDLGLVTKKDRLLAPESPPKGSTPTVVGEITRLMKDIAPVTYGADVVDRNLSGNIVYERDRLDAVQDLCRRIFCDYRWTGDGQMEIYSILEQEPVAVLTGGPEGLLVKVDRAQDIEGLYNQFVVDGTYTDNEGRSIPIRSITQIESGPLSVFGPHGRVPEFYSSNMIANQGDADEYADSMAVSQLTGMTVDLAVTCLPLPHLEIGDWVNVGNPVVNGEPVDLIGRVKSIDLGSANGTAPGPMSVIVQCSYWTVQSVIGSGRNKYGY